MPQVKQRLSGLIARHETGNIVAAWAGVAVRTATPVQCSLTTVAQSAGWTE
jgi:hypothetical protein